MTRRLGRGPSARTSPPPVADGVPRMTRQVVPAGATTAGEVVTRLIGIPTILFGLGRH